MTETEPVKWASAEQTAYLEARIPGRRAGSRAGIPNRLQGQRMGPVFFTNRSPSDRPPSVRPPWELVVDAVGRLRDANGIRSREGALQPIFQRLFRPVPLGALALLLVLPMLLVTF